MFTDHDIHLFKQGTQRHLQRKMGCHLAGRDGVAGAYFAVWAPNARRVSVAGARESGGTSWGNLGAAQATGVGAHARPHSTALTLPPLSTLYLTNEPHG